MEKKSPTIIIIAILAVAAVGLASLYIYLFISLSGMGEARVGSAGKVVDAESVLEQEAGNRKKLAAFFVQDGEQAAFVSSTESVCASLSLACSVESLNETPDESGVIKTLNMSVSVKGALSNINMLIASFESSPYPIIVAKTFLSADEESGWGAVFDITVPVLINK